MSTCNVLVASSESAYAAGCCCRHMHACACMALTKVSTWLPSPQVNERYLSQLQQVLTFPQSVGIVGGRPSASLYFVGWQGANIMYLDPHEVQQVGRAQLVAQAFLQCYGSKHHAACHPSTAPLHRPQVDVSTPQQVSADMAYSAGLCGTASRHGMAATSIAVQQRACAVPGLSSTASDGVWCVCRPRPCQQTCPPSSAARRGSCLWQPSTPRWQWASTARMKASAPQRQQCSTQAQCLARLHGHAVCVKQLHCDRKQGARVRQLHGCWYQTISCVLDS
jgi:hypothetical protein